jgi:hypothetical protein
MLNLKELMVNNYFILKVFFKDLFLILVLCLGLLPFTEQFVFYDNRGVVDSKMYEKFKLENGCQVNSLFYFLIKILKVFFSSQS